MLLGDWTNGGGLVISSAHKDVSEETKNALVDSQRGEDPWADSFDAPSVMAALRAAFIQYDPAYLEYDDPDSGTTVHLDEDDFTDEELAA
jgi:hypothetical protein